MCVFMKHFRMTAKCQIVAWNVIEDSQMRENWKITWWVSIWSWGRMFVGMSLSKMNQFLRYSCLPNPLTDSISRYGCDQSYNDRSNRRQHEKRAHGIVGPREAEKEELERKLSEKESFHPTKSFDPANSVSAQGDANLLQSTCLPPRPYVCR